MNHYTLHEHQSTYECGTCGAVVADRLKHDKWHSRIVTMFGGPPPVVEKPPVTERVAGA